MLNIACLIVFALNALIDISTCNYESAAGWTCAFLMCIIVAIGE